MSNQAKDWQKGYYTVLVDNTTLAVSKKVKTGVDGCGFPTYKTVTATARCSPEDEFSLSMGVALAMDRLSKKLNDSIEIGDKVKIVDKESVSAYYPIWVSKHVSNLMDIARYAYGSLPNISATYEVMVIGPHDMNDERQMVYIKRNDGLTSLCYLVDIKGLEKIYD